MGFYVAGFDQFPLRLAVVKSNHPAVDPQPTEREAIQSSINYCQHVITEWTGDTSAHGRDTVRKMRTALAQLNILLTNYP
jgi:hypothetical protein